MTKGSGINRFLQQSKINYSLRTILCSLLIVFTTNYANASLFNDPDSVTINSGDTVHLDLENGIVKVNWTVKAGTELSCHFLLKNNTKDTVFLHRILTGGGDCYVRNAQKNLLPQVIYPGEDVLFELYMKTAGLSGIKNRVVRLIYAINEEKTPGELKFEFIGEIVE